MVDTTQIIDELCQVIERLAGIVTTQAMALEQLGAVAMADEIAAAQEGYAKAMGEEVDKRWI